MPLMVQWIYTEVGLVWPEFVIRLAQNNCTEVGLVFQNTSKEAMDHIVSYPLISCVKSITLRSPSPFWTSSLLNRL